MKIDETLVSLDNSWSREEVLYKLKNGLTSEKIINEFFNKNNEDIKKLSKCFLPKDKELLKHLEELSINLNEYIFSPFGDTPINLISSFNDLSEKPPPQAVSETTRPPVPISYLCVGENPEVS